MKTIRRVVALCLVVAGALAFSASTAAAQQEVYVENPGTYPFESELSFGVYAHSMGFTFPVLRCLNEWELEVQEDGHFLVHVHDILLHPGGGTGSCGGAQACDNEPWEGQIVEDGEGGFEAHFAICFDGTGTGIDNVTVPIECSLADTELHCNWQVPNTSVEIEGEVNIDGSLGLMHVPDVVVESPGEHAMTSEVDFAVVAHIGGGVEIPAIRCDNDWELAVDAEGGLEIEVDGIASHAGSTGLCDTMHACGDGIWDGEIVEDGAGGFVAEFDFCLDETSAGIDGVVYELECPIANAEMHCDQTIVPGAGTLLQPRVEVQGEAAIGTSLGLMHAE